MNEIPMSYLNQGDVLGALRWVFNNYIGYGIIWLLIGITIYGVTYKKSKSTAVSGLIFSMFLALINSQLPIDVQAYFTLLSALMLFMVIYRVVR